MPLRVSWWTGPIEESVMISSSGPWIPKPTKSTGEKAGRPSAAFPCPGKQVVPLLRPRFLTVEPSRSGGLALGAWMAGEEGDGGQASVAGSVSRPNFPRRRRSSKEAGAGAGGHSGKAETVTTDIFFSPIL